jgi:hypothetical protein
MGNNKLSFYNNIRVYGWVRRKIVLIFAFILILNLNCYANSEQTQDRFASDRFIFIGWNNNKPILATLEYERGFSPQKRDCYTAEFNGHLYFSSQWNHLKNGIYVQGNAPFIPDEMLECEEPT